MNLVLSFSYRRATCLALLWVCVSSSGCAEDVVLGEHVTTSPEVPGAEETSSSSDTVTTAVDATSDPTRRCLSLPDAGRPIGKDERHEHPEWFRDAGQFDCWLVDAGPRPRMPPPNVQPPYPPCPQASCNPYGTGSDELPDFGTHTDVETWDREPGAQTDQASSNEI